MEIIFENYWMKIRKAENKYSIQYNSGDLIDSTREIDISEEDAIIAQQSEKDAYNVIIKHQNIEMGLA